MLFSSHCVPDAGICAGDTKVTKNHDALPCAPFQGGDGKEQKCLYTVGRGVGGRGCVAVAGNAVSCGGTEDAHFPGLPTFAPAQLGAPLGAVGVARAASMDGMPRAKVHIS